MSSKFNNVAIVLHGFGTTNTVKVNDNNMNIQKSLTVLLNPISQFDPQGTGKPVEGSNTQTVVMKNSKEKITVQL